MTATEKAKRSDALYYETVSVNRRVLCDMVANREADLEDAKAENAKLRDGANAMRQLYEDELKHALDENAKLRDERREYQATIDSLVDECADHKAENDRLWEYIAHKRLLQDFARLVDENSKLRKLVRDMWEGYNDPRCEECHLKDTPTCADCPICAREASVIDRMRELGVEVDA